MKHSPTMWDTFGPGVMRLNTMPRGDAVDILESLGGSRPWAERVAELRPFDTIASLEQSQQRAWEALSREELLAAFAKHPRIGERDLHQARFAAMAEQAGNEQSGMAGATEEQRRAFEIGNAEYERRFGHVFLICATGKHAPSMLDQLRIRLNNDPAIELANALGEQAQITSLRVLRWLST